MNKSLNNLNPLVSIVVVTYNSAKFILETLDSIFNQTYQNIELIITDDCSSDDTIKICNDWLQKNKQRFARTGILIAERNSGIASNCNRGLCAAMGDWVSFFAGDDVFEVEMISRYIEYINRNESVACLYSNIREYNNIFKDEFLLPTHNLNKLKLNQIETTASEQFKILLRSNPVWAVSTVIRKDVLISLGGFNEKYPFFEDRPLLLALTHNNYKIHYLDFFGAKYRRHKDSVQVKNNKIKFISDFKLNQQLFFLKEYCNYFSSIERIVMKYRYKKDLLIKYLFNNRKNVFVQGINYILEIFPRIFLMFSK